MLELALACLGICGGVLQLALQGPKPVSRASEYREVVKAPLRIPITRDGFENALGDPTYMKMMFADSKWFTEFLTEYSRIVMRTHEGQSALRASVTPKNVEAGFAEAERRGYVSLGRIGYWSGPETDQMIQREKANVFAEWLRDDPTAIGYRSGNLGVWLKNANTIPELTELMDYVCQNHINPGSTWTNAWADKWALAGGKP